MTTKVSIGLGGSGANSAAAALAALGAGLPAINIVTGTSTTAIVNQNYVLTNVAQTSITLPSTANAGDPIWVSCDNGLSNNTIVRNGHKIKSVAENLVIDVANVTVQLRYVNANVGWTIT